MIRRWENGRVAWSATLRYAVALAFPLWDGGDAPGRAYTPRGRRRRGFMGD
jgi:hypothetical protein